MEHSRHPVENRMSVTKTFLKPLEMDIRNYLTEEDKSTRLKAFKAVLDDDEDYLINYIKQAVIETTLERQTPLMLAALLNKKPLVKILIDEAGIIDNLDFQAIDYTSNKEIIEMLERRGEAIFEEEN